MSLVGNRPKRETVALATWKERVRKRIEEGKLPITLEELENMDMRDMTDDMRAHSIRMTKDRGDELKRALEHVPIEQLKGVLTWHDYLAREHGETECTDLEDMLIDISCRRVLADKHVLGASRRLQGLLDKIYVRLVGDYPYAWRNLVDRPWYLLRTPGRLQQEDDGLARPVEFFRTDDELKLLSLLIAVADRTKHNITDMPPALEI